MGFIGIALSAARNRDHSVVAEVAALHGLEPIDFDLFGLEVELSAIDVVHMMTDEIVLVVDGSLQWSPGLTPAEGVAAFRALKRFATLAS